MTTAVYCHKARQIAIDSRLSANDRIVADAYNKVIAQNDHLFFTSGSTHNIQEAVNSWFTGDNKWKGDRFSFLVVCPNKTVTCFYSYQGQTYKILTTYNDGVGSGCDWALAALDFGCTVEAAVEYAKTKDSSTGGKVRVYDINSGEWLP